jgi:hypothetical protein
MSDQILPYANWQEALRKRWFRSENANRNILLEIDEADLGNGGLGSLADLVAAIKAEYQLRGTHQTTGFFNELSRRARIARSGADQRPPETLPGLAALILAVHHGGTRFAPNAYYPRLKDLLQLDRQPKTADLIKATVAWESIERWANKDMRAQQGIVQTSPVGGMDHIGIPGRQALLSLHDEKLIRAEFMKEGLEPGASVPKAKIIEVARRAGSAAQGEPRLRARVVKILDQQVGATSLRDELHNQIERVFEEWVPSDEDLEPSFKGRRKRLVRLSIDDYNLYRIRKLSIRFPEQPGDDMEEDVPWRGRLKGISNDGRSLEEEVRVRFPADGNQRLVEVEDGEPLWKRMDLFKPFELVLTEETGERGQPRVWTLTYLGACAGSGEILLERDASGQLWQHHRNQTVLAEGAELWKLSAKQTGALTTRTLDGYPPVYLGQTCRSAEGISEASDSKRLRFLNGISASRATRTYFNFGLPLLQLHAAEAMHVRIRLGASSPQQRSLDPADPISLQDLLETSEASSSQPSQLVAELLDAAGAAVHTVALTIDWCTTASATCEAPPARNAWGSLVPACGANGEIWTSLALRGDDSAAATGTVTFTPGEDGVPPRSDPAQWLSESHRQLSRYFRTRASVRPQVFREHFPTTDRNSYPIGWSQSRQLAALHALGCLEIEESPDGGWVKLAALPPRVSPSPSVRWITHPIRGGSAWRQFDLRGMWLPEEIEALETAIGNLESEAAPQSDTNRIMWELRPPSDKALLKSLVPGRRRILVAKNKIARLEAAIETVRKRHPSVQYIPGPAEMPTRVPTETDRAEAPAILNYRDALKSLRDLADQSGAPWCALEADPTTLYRYERIQRFDPIALTLQCVSGCDPNLQVECLECESRNHRRVHIVVDRIHKRFASFADRQLARWIARNLMAPGAPMIVSVGGALGRDLAVPLELQLPRHLERLLCFQSNQPPNLAQYWADPEDPNANRYASPFHGLEAQKAFMLPAAVRVGFVRRFQSATPSGTFVVYPEVYGRNPVWPEACRMPVLGAEALPLNPFPSAECPLHLRAP